MIIEVTFVIKRSSVPDGSLKNGQVQIQMPVSSVAIGSIFAFCACNVA